MLNWFKWPHQVFFLERYNPIKTKAAPMICGGFIPSARKIHAVDTAITVAK